MALGLVEIRAVDGFARMFNPDGFGFGGRAYCPAANTASLRGYRRCRYACAINLAYRLLL